MVNRGLVTLGPKYSLMTSPSTKVTGNMIIPQVCSIDECPIISCVERCGRGRERAETGGIRGG